MRRAALIIVALNVVRLAFGFAFDLAPQEAYYFFYSQHPALSYFDHPPGIAIALWLFTSVLGKSEIALRLTAFTLSCGTQLAFWALARRVLPRSRRLTAILLLTTTAMFSIVSLISLPDVPLLLFWTRAVLQLYRAVFEKKRWGWLLGGLFMGLAFDSKYTACFLQVGLLVFLLASRPHRRLLRTGWPYLSVLTAHVAMLPVYVWNAQHGLASFLFQTSGRASGARGLNLRYLAGLFGSQSFMLLPPLLFALVYLAVRYAPLFVRGGRPSKSKSLFLLSFFAPLAGLFTAISLVALVKPNWLIPTYVTGILFVARFVPRWVVRWNLGISAFVHLALAVQLVFYPFPVRSDDTWFGWRDLARQVAALKDQYPGAFVFSADNYKTSAVLRFYLDEPVYAGNVLGQPALQFDYVDRDLSRLKGRDALFLDSQPLDFHPGRSGRRPPRELVERFREVEERDPILVMNRGAIARKFFVYVCRGYLEPEEKRAIPVTE